MWFEQHPEEDFLRAIDRLQTDRGLAETILQSFHFTHAEVMRALMQRVHSTGRQIGSALVFQLKDTSFITVGPTFDPDLVEPIQLKALEAFSSSALSVGEYSVSAGLKVAPEGEDFFSIGDKLGLDDGEFVFTSRVWLNLRGQVWISHVFSSFYSRGPGASCSVVIQRKAVSLPCWRIPWLDFPSLRA